eukprot:symbB.v1.2.018674.t1/scaffold1455.1/size117749/10
MFLRDVKHPVLLEHEHLRCHLHDFSCRRTPRRRASSSTFSSLQRQGRWLMPLLALRGHRCLRGLRQTRKCCAAPQTPNLLTVVRSSAKGDRLRVQYKGFFLAGFKGRWWLIFSKLAYAFIPVVVLTGVWPLWCYDHGAEDRSGGAQAPCVFVHTGSTPSAPTRPWLGVGGSFTEAAAVTWQKLSPGKREELITAYFHPIRGLGFTLGRVPIGSCDFSLYNWSCGEIKEDDWDLKGFSIKRYEEAILPMLRAASKHIELKLMASPWSPPPWMKTVKSFHGEG